MHFTVKLPRLRKRLASVTLMLVLLGSLFMPYDAGHIARAADTGKYLRADDLIASAAKYLGAPYKLGAKGYKNAYGENIRTYPMAMNDILKNGLDCSGLFYNALTDLGVSTEGYLDNHPVPLATASWFKASGAPYDAKFHINGQEVQPTVVYSGRKNGSRPYYYKNNSGSETIEPGSLVIALPPEKGSSGHCWIYLGEFANRNAVLDYLVSLGFERGSVDKYVGTGGGDGGRHWRIESTAGKNLGSVNKNFKGVMINNATNSTSDLGKVGCIQVTTTSENNTVNTINSDVFTQVAPMEWVYDKDPNYTGTVYGVIGDTEGWWFVQDGVVQLAAYGMESSAEHGRKVMINHGRVDLNYNNSFSEDEHQTVYCIKNGIYAWDYTGAAKMSVDIYDKRGNIIPALAWWRVEKGIVNRHYEGVAKNEFGWWYFKNGTVQFTYTGIQKNEKGWWRIENGKVNFEATGVYKNEKGWWRVKNGYVDFYANGIYKNENGWWKTTKGNVTFKETGVFQNENGWWYVKNSKVDFTKNGKVKYNGKTYNVTNGRAKVV